MAFVKVVGVVRSTTFVFKVLCTSIKKFGVFRVQTQSHRHVDGQSAAAPRRRARRATSAFAPTPHRPRPTADRGAPSPCATPRGSSESSRGHARRRPRRTAPLRATDHRSVSGAPPYVRRPWPMYNGRISAVTPSSSRLSRPYKCRAFCPSSC
jgi:hypothetical protein